MEFRLAQLQDLQALAAIRGTDEEAENHWFNRISGYYNGTHSPQQALAPRVIIVATESFQVIGFIAGHLTTRYDCDGELQWLDTTLEYRRMGIATNLLRLLTNWFIDHNAKRICVNCASDNQVALNFYKKNGAVPLNDYWLVWEEIR